MKPIKKVTVVNQVVFQITEYIHSEGLSYGSKLPTEFALCEELDVARSSLREAYRILHAQGVVTIKPGKGAYVSSPLMNESVAYRTQWFNQHKVQYDDLLEVRDALETLAVRTAAVRISEEGLHALQRNLLEFGSLMDDKDNYKALAELDQQFHKIIFNETRNTILQEINKHIEDELLIFRYAMMKIEERRKNTYLPHKQILEALETHNPDACSKAMQEHLRTARDDMDEMAREHAK